MLTSKERRNLMSLKATIDFIMQHTDLTKAEILSMQLTDLTQLRNELWEKVEK